MNLVLLGVLGRWKLVGVSAGRTNLLDKVVSPIRPFVGLKGEEKVEKNKVFITYDWVIRYY